MLQPGTKAWRDLRAFFGDEVLLPDGNVNRARLGEIVFDDIEKRKKLNAITHPRIQRAMMKMAISYFFSGHSYIVMEVPLLFETGKMLTFMHKIITVVWWVYISVDVELVILPWGKQVFIKSHSCFINMYVLLLCAQLIVYYT